MLVTRRPRAPDAENAAREAMLAAADRYRERWEHGWRFPHVWGNRRVDLLMKLRRQGGDGIETRVLIGERDPARPAGPHHHRGGGLRAASTEP